MSLGPELVTEGAFDNGGAAWTLGPSWTIVDEKSDYSRANDSDDSLSQVLSIPAGTYQLDYLLEDVSFNIVDNGVRVSFICVSDVVSSVYRNMNGAYPETIILPSELANMTFQPSHDNPASFSIDNVSVREVIQDGSSFDFSSDPNDIWDF